MTQPDPGAVFDALAELARRYPHWRAGQVVANAAGWADAAVWDVEDADLLAAVQDHLAGGHMTGLPNPLRHPGPPKTVPLVG